MLDVTQASIDSLRVLNFQSSNLILVFLFFCFLQRNQCLWFYSVTTDKKKSSDSAAAWRQTTFSDLSLQKSFSLGYAGKEQTGKIPLLGELPMSRITMQPTTRGVSVFLFFFFSTSSRSAFEPSLYLYIFLNVELMSSAEAARCTRMQSPLCYATALNMSHRRRPDTKDSDLGEREEVVDGETPAIRFHTWLQLKCH